MTTKSDTPEAQMEQLIEYFIKRQISKSSSKSLVRLSSSSPVPTITHTAENSAQEYIDFTYKNPTTYHVVNHFSNQLDDSGFSFILEKESWAQLKPGKYWTVRSGTSLAAFIVGKDWKPSMGVGIIGCHIDALTTILKPYSTKAVVEGFELLGVAPYAGALSDVWWDRDLGIGGRLLVKSDHGVRDVLVDSTPHPIARIPTLAPHFGAPSKGPFNKETQAVPVIGFSNVQDAEDPATEDEQKSPLYGKHPLKLIRYIAELAKIPVSDIVQWDLQLYDVQKGCIGGLNKEFIFAPRVDDRVCSFAALNALISSAENHKSDQFSLVTLFDNEEIGSLTRQGARGGLLELVVGRVISSFNTNNTTEAIKLAYANSVVLSADVTHLFNPNFAEQYMENHRPIPNKGLTVALDPNGNMTTDSVGLGIIQHIAKKRKLEIQYFQVRNDSPSGGTIGPHISSLTGALTIDLGIPQLSMHSIRAALGSKDIELAWNFFTGFFSDWRETYDLFESV